jgi:hypothetical protein
MSRWGRFILVGGVLLTGLFIYAIASQPTRGVPRPPELGGQQVPAKAYQIRFDRKYDLFCSFYQEEPTTYRNCKILGFTGRDEEESAGTGRASGSSGFVFSSASSQYREYFDHWLVLELADGRLAYIPPSAVKYIEEASPAGP